MIEAANILPYKLESDIPTKKDQQIVLVGGCFDILHYGHIRFLQLAKQQGEFLVVALEPDETVTGKKRKKLFHNQDQRAANLAALRCVNLVLTLPVLVGFSGYNQLTIDVNPQVIAITEGDPETQNKQLHADTVGAKLAVVIDRIDGLSSSEINEKGNLESSDLIRLRVD